MNHTAPVSLSRGAICLAVVAVLGLAGCGSGKDKKPGQMLASVNGEEITVMQLNEELTRANVSQAQQAAAKKQLLESLVDRQLVLNEAATEKTDRDPKVMQAIERAKALIVAQAYMQKRVAAIARPTKTEINEYFDQHPELFAHRKTFDLRQLVLATKDLNEASKPVIDSVKSLDELAAWFDAHGVKYARAQLVRNSVELPPALSGKLLAMPKGERFIVREGERSIIGTITEIRDTPVTLDASAAQIEQFLYNKKVKEAGDAEIARLRAAAKIDYANPADRPSATPAAAAGSASSDANERGVAGLK